MIFERDNPVSIQQAPHDKGNREGPPGSTVERPGVPGYGGPDGPRREAGAGRITRWTTEATGVGAECRGAGLRMKMGTGRAYAVTRGQAGASVGEGTGT